LPKEGKWRIPAVDSNCKCGTGKGAKVFLFPLSNEEPGLMERLASLIRRVFQISSSKAFRENLKTSEAPRDHYATIEESLYVIERERFSRKREKPPGIGGYILWLVSY
jgi:hypothetical protein